MKVSAIYDQGTAPYREDGLVVAKCHFGVIDGVSAPYAPNYPMRKFNGLSGGEMVARLCEQVAYAASPDLDVIDLVLDCNQAVGRTQRFVGLSLDDAGQLAGASFAFAYAAEDRVRILQAGDCMAVVELSWSTVVSTNRQLNHEVELIAEMERLQREIASELFCFALEEVPEEKRGQVRNEMWNRFYSTYLQARRCTINRADSPQGYGHLNGQPELQKFFWEKGYYRNEVRTVILLSDGMVPWDIRRNMNEYQIGGRALDEFRRSGLSGLLLWARGIEEKTAATSYIDKAEATGIALDFSDEK